MLNKLFSTTNQWGPLILRLALGIMILPHGAQKLFGWFGGYGFSGTMEFFTQSMGIPYPFALAAILAEFFGGIALILGITTRIAAAAVGGTLFVGALMVHIQHGFFMNWSGSQGGEGIEFHLLTTAISAVLVLYGSGKWGLDRIFSEKLP